MGSPEHNCCTLSHNLRVYDCLHCVLLRGCAFRLNADPENVTKNRLAGRLDDREEFGMIESSMTYGCVCRVGIAACQCACARVRVPPRISVSFSSAGVGTYTVTLSSIPGRVFTLSMVDGHPRLQTHIAGQHAFIERAFLETKVPVERAEL